MNAVADIGNAAVVTAAARYEHLATDRSMFLERAKRCARLTIPFLFNEPNAEVPNDYQSLGARCVNNLAAKLLLALYPPGSAFFKLAVDDFVLESLQSGPDDARAGVETALAKIERSVMQRLESGGFRAPTSTTLKHLIVGGNGLLEILPKGKLKFRSLNSYVVKRDLDGNVLEIITKDEMARASLPAKIQQSLAESPYKPQDSNGKSISVFTYVKRKETGGGWTVFQEVCGEKVDGSDGTYPEGKCPFLPLRFIVVEGEDYGRGYVEEYQGDLASYDSLQESLVGFAAVASKILFFVDESGFTQRVDIQNARNGDILEGNAKDLTAFQLDKMQDFSVANSVAEGIKMRLEQAFLMASSAQRNAERVTAEEIRLIAGELEQTLGGIYSVLAQEMQMPMVDLTMAQLQREGELPALPKDTVSPQIVTGLEGLGRNSELQRMASFVAQIQPLGPNVIAEYMVAGVFMERLAASLSIDVKGMVRPEADVQKARQEAAQQALAQKAIGPAINASANQSAVA